ncbi:hypothetical protein KFU94_48470 [Chloroflexi bacterium TSY]|nr:hypothetical protein [Chloroflexi bacterium TSY]
MEEVVLLLLVPPETGPTIRRQVSSALDHHLEEVMLLLLVPSPAGPTI